MTRVYKPRVLAGREYERWLLDVTKQVDQGQPLADNEMLTYFGAEPSIAAENSALSVRVDSIERLVHTITFNEQTAREALQAATDATLLAWMGDI